MCVCAPRSNFSSQDTVTMLLILQDGHATYNPRLLWRQKFRLVSFGSFEQQSHVSLPSDEEYQRQHVDPATGDVTLVDLIRRQTVSSVDSGKRNMWRQRLRYIETKAFIGILFGSVKHGYLGIRSYFLETGQSILH